MSLSAPLAGADDQAETMGADRPASRKGPRSLRASAPHHADALVQEGITGTPLGFADLKKRCAIREKRMSLWAERQGICREWIGFSEIAEWCARESGSIHPDENAIAEAYNELAEALIAGEVERDVRHRVLLL